MGSALDRLLDAQVAANEAAGAVQQAGSDALGAVQTMGGNAIDAVNDAGTTALGAAKGVGGSLLDQATTAVDTGEQTVDELSAQTAAIIDNAEKTIREARERLRVSNLTPEEKKAEETKLAEAKLAKSRARATLMTSALTVGGATPIRGGFEALKSLGNDMTMGEGYAKGVKDQQIAVSDARDKLGFGGELLAEGIGSAIGPGKAFKALKWLDEVGPGMMGAGKKMLRQGAEAAAEGVAYDALHNQDVPNSVLDALSAGIYFGTGVAGQGVLGEIAPRAIKWATGKVPGEQVGAALYGATGRDRQAFLDARKAAQQDGSGILPTLGGSKELPIEGPTTLMDMTNSAEPGRRLAELTAATNFPNKPKGKVGAAAQRSRALLDEALKNVRREQARIRLSNAIGINEIIGNDMEFTQSKMRSKVKEEAATATSSRYDRFFTKNQDSKADYDKVILPNLLSGMKERGSGFTEKGADGKSISANLTGDSAKMWQETLAELRPQKMDSTGEVSLTPRWVGRRAQDAQPLGDVSMAKLVAARQRLNNTMQAGRFLDGSSTAKISGKDMEFAAKLRQTLDDEIVKMASSSELGEINFDYKMHMKKIDAAADGAAVFNGMEDYSNPITSKNAIEHYRSLSPDEQIYFKNAWYNELDKKMSSEDGLAMLEGFFGEPVDRSLSMDKDYANELLKYRKGSKNVRILEEILGKEETAKLAKLYDVNANREAVARETAKIWEERTLEGMTHSSPVAEALEWRTFLPGGSLVGGPGRASVTGEAAMRKRFGTPGKKTAELIAKLKTAKDDELESLLDQIDKDWLMPRSRDVGGRAGIPLAMTLSPGYEEEGQSQESLMDELKSFLGNK